MSRACSRSPIGPTSILTVLSLVVVLIVLDSQDQSIISRCDARCLGGVKDQVTVLGVWLPRLFPDVSADQVYKTLHECLPDGVGVEDNDPTKPDLTPQVSAVCMHGPKTTR
ncbi:hypothetical protein Bbelb_030290 [Branchiostoma belcheri]|nr:hypothetical protein Bbelb_030290 [Branchiostoma belcheri]